jgi:hypothetical protein
VREYSIDPFELLRVAEVMVTKVDTLPATMKINEAVAFFADEARPQKSYPILDANGLVVGMVGRPMCCVGGPKAHIARKLCSIALRILRWLSVVRMSRCPTLPTAW